MDYLLFLQGLRESVPDFVNLFFLYASEIAGSALPVAVGVILFWCIDKKSGYLVMSGYVACTAINQVVKNIACVYRPWILDSRIHPYEAALPGATGYSFPSGHTAVSVGFFGGLALLFKDRKKLVALFISLIVVVAFSRNWLGCHTPQDVLCSAIIATVSLLATNQVLVKVEEKPNYDLIASAVFFAASVGFTIFCCLKSYPLDYDAAGNLLVNPQDMMVDCFKTFGALFGISIAWPLERHCIKFSVEGSTRTRVVRALVGLLVLGATAAFGKFLLPLVLDAGIAKFIEYALLALVGVAVYPALFSWFERKRANNNPEEAH